MKKDEWDIMMKVRDAELKKLSLEKRRKTKGAP